MATKRKSRAAALPTYFEHHADPLDAEIEREAARLYQWITTTRGIIANESTFITLEEAYERGAATRAKLEEKSSWGNRTAIRRTWRMDSRQAAAHAHMGEYFRQLERADTPAGRAYRAAFNDPAFAELEARNLAIGNVLSRHRDIPGERRRELLGEQHVAATDARALLEKLTAQHLKRINAEDKKAGRKPATKRKARTMSKAQERDLSTRLVEALNAGDAGVLAANRVWTQAYEPADRKASWHALLDELERYDREHPEKMPPGSLRQAPVVGEVA